jgi:hypothetical protein
VLTGAEEGEGYGYGYGYGGYGQSVPPQQQSRQPSPMAPYENPSGNGADVPDRSQSPTNLL